MKASKLVPSRKDGQGEGESSGTATGAFSGSGAPLACNVPAGDPALLRGFVKASKLIPLEEEEAAEDFIEDGGKDRQTLGKSSDNSSQEPLSPSITSSRSPKAKTITDFFRGYACDSL